MVNRRALSLTLEDTSGIGDANTMDKLRRQNQTLEDNVHTIKHRQQ